MIPTPHSGTTCGCTLCASPRADERLPSAARRKLALALGAGLFASFAGKAALATDNLLDPTKIGGAKKAAQPASDLLAPLPKSTVPVGASGGDVPVRVPRGNRPAPSYGRGMAASVVSSFDGFTNAVSRLHAKLKSLNEREKKVLAELALLKAQYAEKMEEYRQGLFCSGCGKTRSEILARGETFPHSGQSIVRPTPAEIAAKERMLQAPIDRLEKELKEIREAKQKTDDEIAEARRQSEAGLRLWRTALSFEVALYWADELDLRAAHAAERKQASNQLARLEADAKKPMDEDARAAMRRDHTMWDGVIRKLDSQRDNELRTFQSNMKNASASAFRERDRLDYYFRREGVKDVLLFTLVSMAIQTPASSLDFLGGHYRMGDFQPSNNGEILSSVRTFITKFAAMPQGPCTALNYAMNCGIAA
jgi:prefoldin subunit 5